MLLLSPPPPDRHSALEDIQALFVGTILIALATQFLQVAGLVTGQVAGMALILSELFGTRFGVNFFVLNLPFYWLAFRRMGRAFTLKTFAAVALMSLFSELLGQWLHIDGLHPLLAGILFGVCAGTGFLVLFRHGASMGGVGIVALYLQDEFAIRAGMVQLGVDLVVFGIALLVFPWPIVAYSVLGSLIVNIIITTNHRRDRYLAR